MVEGGAVVTEGGRRDGVAVHVADEDMVHAFPLVALDSAFVRIARIERRAASARNDIRDPVALGSIVDVVVAAEHGADAVLDEERAEGLPDVEVAAVRADGVGRLVEEDEDVGGLLLRGGQILVEPAVLGAVRPVGREVIETDEVAGVLIEGVVKLVAGGEVRGDPLLVAGPADVVVAARRVDGNLAAHRAGDLVVDFP